MTFQLTLVGRLRAMAGLVTIAVVGVASYTGFAYYQASIDQRLSTTRAVVVHSKIAITKIRCSRLGPHTAAMMIASGRSGITRK